MMENEKLIKSYADAIDCLKKNKPTSGFYMLQESVDMAIKALEDIQLYRELGLSPNEVIDLLRDYRKSCKSAEATAHELEEYTAIGTAEECRVAVEKWKENEWISCADKLPDDGDCRFYMCLVENHAEDVPMFCQYEEELGFGFYQDIYDKDTLGFVDTEFNTNEELGYENVLYWRQMPEPPKDWSDKKMNEELKPCPFCGNKIDQEKDMYLPERDWEPTFCDPDSGGDPINIHCKCGLEFSTGTYDYAEFLEAWNRRINDETD